MEQDEIIITDENQNNNNNNNKNDKNIKELSKNMFTSYLSLGFSLIAIILGFIARFSSACKGYDIATWFSLLMYVAVAIALVIEIFNFIKTRKLEFKGSVTLVLAIAFILI